jgi:ubiquinone biosynthesis protein
LHKRAYSDLDMGDLMAKILDETRRGTRLLVFVACATGVIAVLVGGMFASGHLHWTP